MAHAPHKLFEPTGTPTSSSDTDSDTDSSVSDISMESTANKNMESTIDISKESTTNLKDDSRVVSMTVGELKELISETFGIKKGKQLKKDLRVPRETKNEIHNAVTDLAKEERQWDFSVGYREGRNPQHTDDVIAMVQSKLKGASRDVVKKGCYTYFHTLKRHDLLLKRKKMDSSLKQQRRRQRMTNLRMRRLASLKSNKTINDRDRANLNTILQTNEYISSEESDFVTGPSGSEDDEEPKVKILVKRKLPWRSCYINELFAELDKGTEKRRRRSKHVGSMTMERREGWASNRKEPIDCEAYALMVYDEP